MRSLIADARKKKRTALKRGSNPRGSPSPARKKAKAIELSDEACDSEKDNEDVSNEKDDVDVLVYDEGSKVHIVDGNREPVASGFIADDEPPLEVQPVTSKSPSDLPLALSLLLGTRD